MIAIAAFGNAGFRQFTNAIQSTSTPQCQRRTLGFFSALLRAFAGVAV